jgi:hypothetical protein
MEEILLNIDSRYRDTLIYPNETKFRYTLEKSIKNVGSIKLASLEVNNSINYISSTRKNNFIKIHLPNKLNDPIGTIIQLEDGFLQLVASINTLMNSIFEGLFNKNSSLQTKQVNGEPISEKYFYFFYLNSDLQLALDFNNADYMPTTLQNPLILQQGWYSMYGMVLQINNYITQKYNERLAYKNNNINDTSVIELDSGNFQFTSAININIFDRRFRSVTSITLNNKLYYQPNANDCIRVDNITINNNIYNANNLATNLYTFKNDFYKFYLYDTSNFIIAITSSDYPVLGILDRMATNSYIIPNGYVGAGTNLLGSSIYYLNNNAADPTMDNTQIYNLQATTNLTSLRISITNTFTKPSSTSGSNTNYYFYWQDITTPNNQSWTTPDSSNVTGNLVIKSYLLANGFITIAQYNDIIYKPNCKKDIASFEIDFNTYNDLNTYLVNNIIDIKNLQYPPLGYYLGFRPDMTKKANKFLISPIWLDTDCIIAAPRMFNTSGDAYIFIRINDYGYLNFFNKSMLGKILMTTGLGNPKIDDGMSKEYRFRQPINIQRLDIELVDYLGNTLDLNGYDWSCTVEIKPYVSSTQKLINEKQALVFS